MLNEAHVRFYIAAHYSYLTLI